ncbi:MAG: TAXI family TRAP transporter solute-binding subunit [Clostridia bacterium]|nr:TAXI family TRAP transporter solute-binding subunit [Clostridia bacterium]
MKKVLTLVLIFVLVFSFAACGSKEETVTKLTFATGGEAGTYYAYGTVLAQYVTANSDIEVTAITGNGSKSNVEDIDAGDIQLAFCQSDVMSYAYQGTSLFQSPVDSFSAVCALYMEDVQIVTCDEQIKTVADLKGKTVSVGAVGSGTYFNAVDVLSVYGLDVEKDITPVYQSFGDSTESLKDNKIDAAFVVAGAPTNSIVDLSTAKQAYIVSLDDEHINKLVEISPYYSKHIIPAGTYGQAPEATTVAVAAMVLAADDVSEDAVYAFISTIFKNKAAVADGHGKGKDLDDNFASSVTAVPYHPGAAKYFSEVGIKVTTKK